MHDENKDDCIAAAAGGGGGDSDNGWGQLPLRLKA